MNILLVDDDQVDRVLVKRVLQTSDINYQINEAVTVDQALEMHALNHYDLILLDYQLPKRNGIEMIKELRDEAREDSTAIVMISSSENEEISLDCIKAGAQDFLLKSEVTSIRLKRAILHASTRFNLEQKLHNTYQKVKRLAETDALTGLSNRYVFEETLRKIVSIDHRNEQKLALILFDLDGFKIVNDSFGHGVGDLLLQKVVARIKSCLRGSELFARLGGDEFVILLTNLDSSDQAGQVARRIVSVLYKPFEVASTSINTSISTGIAFYPESGSTGDVLLRHADIAMYRAKSTGTNQICFFENEMQRKFQQRVNIESELRSAIDRNQFRLYYQPVINPKTKKATGFEALIRWEINGETRLPEQFISIAEDSGLIVSIGAWVINEAIAMLSQWNKKNSCSYTMAINLSAHQLAEKELVSHIERSINKYNVAAELIDIELTETALLKNTSDIRNSIVGIANLNCRLSLDDFGTGFSSISHLRDYPISVVKIDKSLMPRDNKDSKNISLVQGVVSMVTVLGLDIIAEGIENEFQNSLCKNLNIAAVQGYYYSTPIKIEDFDTKYL